MKNTDSDSDSLIGLKVGIEGVQTVRGLKMPTNKFLNLGKANGMRVNNLGFYYYCQICLGRLAQNYCKTESCYTCYSCVDFCHMHAHNWEALWVPIGGRSLKVVSPDGG